MSQVKLSTEIAFPNLKAWRAAQNDGAGINLHEAAALLGLSASQYRAYELGFTTPRKAARDRIVERTGVPVESLIGAA